MISGSVGEVVVGLREVAAVIDLAHALGLSPEVPESLYRACVEIVSRCDQPVSRDVPVRDVPLRRLVWKAIDSGEFTVADVTGRLAAIGAPWPANKVSNALGYWVSHGRLTRVRKGVYSRPGT